MKRTTTNKGGGKITHGQRIKSGRTPEYAIWDQMKQRCINPKHKAYSRYGGRGITVCESWLKFENFFLDMGKRPSDSHSLDRINNDGNYDPTNCRWATSKEQQRNTRTTKMITYNGKIQSLSDWAEELGIGYNTLKSRINRNGWDIGRAFNSPTRPSSFTNSIEQEFIICSAILYDDGQSHTHQPKNVTTGIVICGRRHHNCIYTAATLLGDNYDKKLIGRVNQGFLTNYDRYVDRKEAFQIAKKARQLLKPELYDNDAVLVSEDLYSEDIFSANPNISSQTLTQIEQDKKQTL